MTARVVTSGEGVVTMHGMIVAMCGVNKSLFAYVFIISKSKQYIY